MCLFSLTNSLEQKQLICFQYFCMKKMSEMVNQNSKSDNCCSTSVISTVLPVSSETSRGQPQPSKQQHQDLTLYYSG